MNHLKPLLFHFYSLHNDQDCREASLEAEFFLQIGIDASLSSKTGNVRLNQK